MIRLTTCLLAFTWGLSTLSAQLPSPTRSDLDGMQDHDRVPQTGKVFVESHPAEPLVKLAQVVAAAELIVEGVPLLNGTVSGDSSRRDAIETHSRIAVGSVWKGTIPGDHDRIVVRQAGGALNGLEVVSTTTPLLQLGKSYVLFLRKERNNYPPNETGLTRYYVVGEWAGIVEVSATDNIRFTSDQAGERLMGNNGSSLPDFRALVEDDIYDRIKPQPGGRPKYPWPFGPG